MVEITRIGTAKPLACKTNRNGKQSLGADGRGAAQSPSTLKVLGVGGFPPRGSCTQVQSSPAPGHSQIPLAALSPQNKEPRALEGRYSYRGGPVFPAHPALTPLSCCMPECSDGSTCTAGGKELQGRCHRSHPSAAATAMLVPISGKLKPTTNIAINPIGNM